MLKHISLSKDQMCHFSLLTHMSNRLRNVNIKKKRKKKEKKIYIYEMLLLFIHSDLEVYMEKIFRTFEAVK